MKKALENNLTLTTSKDSIVFDALTDFSMANSHIVIAQCTSIGYSVHKNSIMTVFSPQLAQRT